MQKKIRTIQFLSFNFFVSRKICHHCILILSEILKFLHNVTVKNHFHLLYRHLCRRLFQCCGSFRSGAKGFNAPRSNYDWLSLILCNFTLSLKRSNAMRDTQECVPFLQQSNSQTPLYICKQATVFRFSFTKKKIYFLIFTPVGKKIEWNYFTKIKIRIIIIKLVLFNEQQN